MSVTIVEGPDGAGKSTLIRNWQEWLDNPLNKFPAKIPAAVTVSNHDAYLGKEEIANEYLDDLLVAYNLPRHVIMDRSWISEFVYGPIARGKVRIDVPRRRALERMALTVGAIVIYCQPPYAQCERAYLSRKEIEYLPTTSKLKEVYDEFAQIQHEDRYPSLPSFGFDWTAGNNRNQTHDFISAIEAMRPIPNLGPGVGSFFRGNTLLIGEQTNPPSSPSNCLLPFISWEGCTRWLSEQLETWQVPENDLYWINAKDSTGEPTKGGAWLKQLRPRKVVAMGESARRWCMDNDLHHVFEVQHPAFHMRFKSKEEYPLKDVLVENE